MDAVWAAVEAAAAHVPAPARDVPVPVQVEGVKESNVSRRWRTKVKIQSLETLDSGNPLMNELLFKTAPHNPPHLFVPNNLYMLTASIYEQVHLIESPQRKAEWREAFHEAAEIYKWQIINYAVYLDQGFDITGMDEVNDVPEF